MSDPGLYFKDKNELLDWFKKEIPDSYSEYLSVYKAIREASFTGNLRLLKRETFDKTIENFLTFLTELNIANLLIRKRVKGLSYESNQVPGVDFFFDKIFLSIKSLNTKNYEKIENEKIEEMKKTGGGKSTLRHKIFSNTFLEVEKNPMGVYNYSRTEIGHSGFFDSDFAQMSKPLEYMGKFESQANINGYKKVLFIFNYSSEFRLYHANDIAYWYFDYLPKHYYRIFDNDPSWYLKLFKKERKENKINAIIFMFSPNSLIWPNNCFKEVIRGNPRVLIYTRDNQLSSELKLILS